MTTQQGPETPQAAEGLRQLEAMPARADAARTEGLLALGRLRTAKTAMLGREQARLTAKYGADHPRVQALIRQIDVNRALVNHVAAEAGRAQVAQVDADPKAWVLHGRVMDQNLRGLEALTVALYDAKGTWVQSLGFACTDSSGYFKLSATPLGGGTTGTSSTQPAPAPAPKRSSRAAKAEDATDSAPRDPLPDGPVYARVLDANSTTLATDPRPLTPAFGRVDYEEIVLGGARPRDCAPPDGKKTTASGASSSA